MKTPILEEYQFWTPEANLYLDSLDQELAARGIAFVRYADDFVLMSETRKQAEDGLQSVREWCAANRLQLHPEKMRLLEVTAKEGFDFLGYHFRAVNHWPGEKGRKNLRTKLRPKLKRNNGRSLEKTIELIMVKAHESFCESQEVLPVGQETTDWRAVSGRTRRKVRREGCPSKEGIPTPYLGSASPF